MDRNAHPQPHATVDELNTLAETNTLVPWQVYAVPAAVPESAGLALATAPNAFTILPGIDSNGNLSLPSGGGLIVGGYRVVAARQAQIPYPTGQADGLDTEARAGIAAIIATLSAHGLTE